jgi:hypothetical protein
MVYEHSNHTYAITKGDASQLLGSATISLTVTVEVITLCYSFNHPTYSCKGYVSPSGLKGWLGLTVLSKASQTKGESEEPS